MAARDPLLFTPGPLTTSMTTKQAMLHDFGSRDASFITVVERVRERLLKIAGVNSSEFTCVLMQGSGTFGVEGVLTTVVPKTAGKLLIASNGAYGMRMAKIADVYGIEKVLISKPENCTYTDTDIQEALAAHPEVTTVALVHSETTSGILNPVEKIGKTVRNAGKTFIVDAMSSFGGIPISMANIDFLVSSSNKCLEGVPGFSFTIARRDLLEASSCNSRTLSLDLHAQNAGLDRNGQFRFTPPTHAILAMDQALDELDSEGGVAKRYIRYKNLQKILTDGYEALGFVPYVKKENQGPIITTFLFPDHLNWDFTTFYQLLSDRGMLIYPGVVSTVDSFRVGNIGRLSEENMIELVEVTAAILKEMNISLKHPTARPPASHTPYKN